VSRAPGLSFLGEDFAAAPLEGRGACIAWVARSPETRDGRVTIAASATAVETIVRLGSREDGDVAHA
jgi:hypothetical protein